MGVLSSFQQLDESFVKFWNDLPEKKMGEDKGMGLKIAKVSRMRDEAFSPDLVVLMGRKCLFLWALEAPSSQETLDGSSLICQVSPSLSLLFL
ncbi:unnamed protein product [Prunus armeniaca]